VTRILVTIGTDHHRFDRLIGWIDTFLAAHPHEADQTLVQHGLSRPSTRAQNRDFLPFEELTTLMASSDVIITHAGPATIFEARAQGRLPLCVPRDPALDEHVDAHQQRFARRLARDSLVLLAEDQPTFERLLEAALEQPQTVRIAEDDSRVRVTAERLDAYVTGVVAASRRRG
jgi:UDP-N-acetylglucosamine transferase subunit ALG13